ncbi:MAG TPA: polyprenyl synthetase family protein [Bacteroidales bacterium]|jgi:octaprenyl-diphosphate synthase|nr:polyprenyl synthetase [Bacteroidota bacterium]HJN05507.1 polyprenyl synthetase family protein [Bacteroidales bacterium]|tara:strand:- start:527 stop:1501 length:975 start_codon:yes stop_codon:yes gene_type:complete
MTLLKDLKKPLSKEIKEFQKIFRKSVKSTVPLLDIIMRYILKTKGKQIRPLIVFYSAALFNGINESTYRAATLIELLHTATLVHDDVVDDSDRRRGRFSINALWKNKIAVLVGDYLLSRGMLMALQAKEYSTLEIVSEAVKEMSEGELLQIEKARKLDIDEAIYFEVIRKKTASLLASCFAAGASSSTNNQEDIKKMWNIGESAGIAFQIKDDLLDFDKSNVIGKPSGIDIKEKKMTLPLIYLLIHSPALKKRKIINIIKKHNSNSDKVNWVVNEIISVGGLKYATEKMIDYSTKALNLLHEYPESNNRLALEQIIEFTIDRKK